MKNYYFVNFTVVVNSSHQSFTHMSVLSTEKDFFPILQAKNKIKVAFDKDIGQDTNVIFNNFKEVKKENFDEFHGNSIADFAEL
ncbi:MAG: hypothetical protein UY05_C0016G0007 [Candidatus Peregrinibacteria bacterium GW2011_GWA2_47_7]|nr:MAG: hypothetical protein UY05_C0016G0007 [Candidatus Peregrinibacteria bacterium GW2011_GWA2_47_7]